MAREGFGDPRRDEDDDYTPEEVEPLNAASRALARDLAARARLKDDPIEKMRERLGRHERARQNLSHIVKVRVTEPTERELEVLKYRSHGLTNRMVADAIGIGIETVKSHIRHVLPKLQAKNATQACCEAIRQGLIP